MSVFGTTLSGDAIVTLYKSTVYTLVHNTRLKLSTVAIKAIKTGKIPQGFQFLP